MKASIIRRGPEELWVELRSEEGVVLEEAGPFDCELDALLMSERALEIAA